MISTVVEFLQMSFFISCVVALFECSGYPLFSYWCLFLLAVLLTG